MTGLLIRSAMAVIGYVLTLLGCAIGSLRDGMPLILVGYALIAAALYLAWRAGGAGV